jgi:DNA polymerase-3 subunit epsilon
MPGPGFAVIDVETTGLFPGRHDRIVELAVVHVDSHGHVTGAWETLLNPGRDLGPQSIHGIRAADVLDAPTFADIVPQLLELLDGRVIVAHNARFDMGFLAAELEAAGVPLWQQPVTLCTMLLARDYLPGSRRALADCCDAFDIPLEGAHRASVDALATASLLAAYMASDADPTFWIDALERAAGFPWPTPPDVAAAREWRARSDAVAEITAATFLERITRKMPEFAGPAEHAGYLAMLDRALIDRHISASEANGLVQLAEALGIDRVTVESLHRRYFDDLTRVAWADGELTETELADIVAVADLLDIPTEAIGEATDPGRWVTLDAPATAASDTSAHIFSLAPGALVVLTGEMTAPRDAIEAELRARGFTPWAGVTKKVALVVAADPDSLSGKARKAREYGIPVVGESALWGLLAG